MRRRGGAEEEDELDKARSRALTGVQATVRRKKQASERSRLSRQPKQGSAAEDQRLYPRAERAGSIGTCTWPWLHLPVVAGQRQRTKGGQV